ncbi:MAG: TolC family protein [Holosporales bacterium]|jgi:outer membrane protein|nr:TolC family protein [Holosporales bacterium]
MLVACDVGAITLEQALIQAYLHSPELAAAIAGKKAKDEAALGRAYSRWQPNITAQYTMTGDRHNETMEALSLPAAGTSPIMRSQSRNAMVKLQQNIFDGFSTTKNISAAEHSVAGARAELIAAEQQLFQRVIAAYLAVWEAHQHLDIARKQETNLASDLHAAEKKFEVGAGTRLEVAAARAQHADTTYRCAFAHANLEAALARFEATIRAKPDNQISLPDIPKGLPTSLEELIQLAQRFCPELKSAQEKALAARDIVSSARGGLLPRVDLEMSAYKNLHASRDENRITPRRNLDQESKGCSGTIVVSIPLLANGGEGNLYSTSRRVSQEALAAEMSWKKVVLDLEAECVRTWNTFKAAEAQLQQSKMAVESAEIAADGVRQAAKYGLKSQTDVLYYEGKLLDARNQAVKIQKDYVAMACTLLALTGRLTSAGLHLKVTPYDVEGNEALARWNPPFVIE